MKPEFEVVFITNNLGFKGLNFTSFLLGKIDGVGPAPESFSPKYRLNDAFIYLKLTVTVLGGVDPELLLLYSSFCM